MDPVQPANSEIVRARSVLDNLAKYVSFNELKRLRLVCRNFNEYMKEHPRFLNGTLVVGRKFPDKHAASVRAGGTGNIPPFRSARCSLHSLERTEFIRNIWRPQIEVNIKRLELYKVGHRCEVIAHFIGVFPVLEELFFNDVAFTGTSILDAGVKVTVRCSHNGAQQIFALRGIQVANSIKKLEFRKMPVIPHCLLEYLAVRTAGVLEEYHYMDNSLGENDRNVRFPRNDQQRQVRNMLRVSLRTLRKFTWKNCPEDDHFIHSLSIDHFQFPTFLINEIHIGQNRPKATNCNLTVLRLFIRPDRFPVLFKLTLEFWESFSAQMLNQLQHLIVSCPVLTSLTLIFNLFVNANGNAIQFPPRLEFGPRLSHLEIRHSKIPGQTNGLLSVGEVLQTNNFPRQLVSLIFGGLGGVNHTPLMTFMGNHMEGWNFRKLCLIGNVNERNNVDEICNATIQQILRTFPLLEELALSCTYTVTDTAFTGIPEKTVKLIYESQSYTLLAHAELNLPDGTQTLSNLKHLKKLKILNCNVGDITLFRSFDLPFLRELDLSYSNVTDMGLMMIPLKAPGVEHLCINCCHNTSALGVCMLLKHSQIQTIKTSQTVLERNHPGLNYSFPVEASRRSAKILVDHNPSVSYLNI